MNRADFLRELDRALSGISYADKKEIMADYEEHFRIGAAEGKSEDEISAALGQPKAIAKAYKADYLVEQAHTDKSAGNIFRAVFAVISLSFFNLIVVLGPFMALVGFLIGLWSAGVGVTIAGVGIFAGSLVAPFMPVALQIPGSLAVAVAGGALLGIGLACLGLLACIGLYYLTILFYKMMVGYLKFNLRIIKG